MRLLEGIPERYWARIDVLQPYHARHIRLPQRIGLTDPLAVNIYLMAVGRLDNIDKHRLLLPGSALAPFVQPEFVGLKRATGTYRSNFTRVEDGAELYRITDWEMEPGATKVQVKTQPTFGITFGNPEFGPLGTETDVWSSDEHAASSRPDLLVAADMIDRILANFASEFVETD